MSENEEKLFKDVIDGDHKALKTLFIKFQPRMMYFACHFTNDKNASSDIVQECFITLWEYRSNISSPSALPSYLFTILKNLCIKYLRKKTLADHFENPEFLLLKQKEIQYWSDKHNVLNDIYFNEMREKYEAALDKLTPQARRIFSMSRDEGLSYKEIASRLNLSVRTVENVVYRSLKIIKNELVDYINVS